MRRFRLAPGVSIGLILLFALVIRLYFFVGLVSGDPQDDGIYYRTAYDLHKSGDSGLAQYRGRPADYLANPIEQFRVRPMVTYPIAWAFAVFGPGEVPAILWPLLCSILSVAVVYRLGQVLHGSALGLVAALLCAFYPIEVINGTRILSDVPVAFFCSLALLSLVEGQHRGSTFWYLLSGGSIAAAYLANARGLIFLAAILASAAMLAIYKRIRWSAPIWIAVGFGMVFAAEAATYFVITGDPFLSTRIQAGASYFKYRHEPVATMSWGWLDIRYTNGQPLDLLRSVLLLDARPVMQFGIFFYWFLAATLFSIARRQNLLLVGLGAGLFLLFEFGPLLLGFNTERRTVEYMMFFKQDRFLMMLTAPLLIVAAYLIQSLHRSRIVVATTVLLVLFVTSIAAISETREYYRAGLTDLRTIAAHVSSHPERQFYGDLWVAIHSQIFTRDRAPNVRALDGGTTEEDVKGSCVILGGGRGVELLSDYVESTLPGFARGVLETGVTPAGWTLVQEIRGPRFPWRRSDLRMYCVA